MGLIYVDACVLIYAMEDDGVRGRRARAALESVDDRLATSALVAHECLVGPLRSGDLVLRSRYESAYRGMTRVGIDESIFLHAAEIRARHGLKTPDALHLAAAQLAGCDALWTNDKRLAEASRGLAVDIFAAGG